MTTTGYLVVGAVIFGVLAIIWAVWLARNVGEDNIDLLDEDDDETLT